MDQHGSNIILKCDVIIDIHQGAPQEGRRRKRKRESLPIGLGKPPKFIQKPWREKIERGIKNIIYDK